MIIYAILLALPALIVANDFVKVDKLFSDFLRSLDSNKDGDISAEETITSLNAIDTNHNGEINFTEFAAYLHTIHPNFKGYEPDVYRYFAIDVNDTINIAKVTAPIQSK
uniref:EF-hand domain-containing protein n=1 Tax=Arion vulgaris TaxID=1028688 RepID=A0A0B6Z6J1_9EUPU